MFSSILNRDTPLDEKAGRDSGKKTYPIWLLVNPKYTVVRYDIWRPVLDEIQDKVYRELHTRIDTTNIYFRCAVKNSEIVPNTLNWWGKEVAKEIDLFREIVLEYKPKMLISFGAFPYEFVRRVCNIKPEKGPKAWSTSILRGEFESSMDNFNINCTNRIPLLRRVVTGDNQRDNLNFVSLTEREAYFHHVGTKIAEKIIENKDNLNIWIE